MPIIAKPASALQTGVLSLSAAQILAFNGAAGTNVQALAAPGSGKAIVIVQAAAVLTAGATPFADGDDIYFGPYGTVGSLMEIVIHGATVRQATNYAEVYWQSLGSNAAATEFLNCPIVAQNFGAQYSAGNGSIKIAYTYFIANFA